LDLDWAGAIHSEIATTNRSNMSATIIEQRHVNQPDWCYQESPLFRTHPVPGNGLGRSHVSPHTNLIIGETPES
jgi:hypothetical protein